MHDMKQIEGKNKIFLGKRKSDKARIYMTKPKFDCDWYWSFGYLGNNQEHYHLESYQQKDHHIIDKEGKFHFITECRNKSMYDCLDDDYELNKDIKRNLWTFCELASTIYALKETADIYNRGGSHYTTNPLQETLKNETKYNELVNDTLPKILQEFWDLMSNVDKYQLVTNDEQDAIAKLFC